MAAAAGNFYGAGLGWMERVSKTGSLSRLAPKFDRAKYDIYAVLGQQEDQITWGKPTRSGPVNLQTFSLKNVQSLRLLVNDSAVDLENPPNAGSAIVLEFLLKDAEAVQVPFTEIPLATKWCQHLQQELQRFL